MLPLKVSLAAIAFIAMTASGQATGRHMFIIGNDGGYGVERCLAGGEKCGAAAANAYCRTQKYAHAAYYRKVARSEITGAIPGADSGCSGGSCKHYVAIICTR
jgi:hypothetical protein